LHLISLTIISNITTLRYRRYGHNLMKTLEVISKELTTLDAIELHGGELTHKEKEVQAVLNLCYDLLSRTQEARQTGRYGITASVITDMLFSALTGDNDNPVNIRIFIVALIARTRKRAAEISRETGVRKATISDFVNDKRAIRTDSLEKIIRYCLNQ